VLELTRDASAAQIKKRFYKLSLRYHPDKNKSTEAVPLFQRMSLAYDILGNPDSREEYHEFLDDPDHYLRHYATYFRRRFLGPQENVWVVLGCLVLISTICDRLYHGHRYQVVREYLRSNRHIIQRVKVLRASNREEESASTMVRSRGKKREKKLKQRDIVITDEELDQVVHLGGRMGRKPTFRDLLVIRMMSWPLYWVKAVYFQIRWLILFTLMRKPFGALEREYLTRKSLEMNEERWNALEEEDRKDLIKRQLWINSNLVAFQSEWSRKGRNRAAEELRGKMWNENDYDDYYDEF
jgi:DnaJ family protein C protein 25